MTTSTILPTTRHASNSKATFEPPVQQEPEPGYVNEVLDQVRAKISPVWPLKDYVAINPYAGLSERPFLNARGFLRVFSDCETLMPLDYYAAEFQRGRFGLADIEAAIEELQQDDENDARMLSAQEVAERLHVVAGSTTESVQLLDSPEDDRRIRTVSEYFDRDSKSDWSANIRDEISKHCSAHYDEGQATWSSPWQGLPLYQAWRAAAAHDRHVEWLGLTGFRKFVAELPNTPAAAIVFLMRKLGVPERLWQTMLLCQAFSIPGWSAWVKYQVESAARAGEENSDLAGLLAIRLAYDAAIAERFCVGANWAAMTCHGQAEFEPVKSDSSQDAILRYVSLRASELAYQQGLFAKLIKAQGSPDSAAPPLLVTSDPLPLKTSRKLAQLVFCIDVRSERMRLERTPLLASDSVAGLLRRSSDWSEVRPEWGLAGNAAFIAAPRSLTDSVNLQGRSFLHNYDHHSDPEGKVLEQIMTAPMIVAHWINMQYYASTVDNRHFGSGTKTVHNVVGRFGIFSGNGGDLMTGLPWESLHDGKDYQHVPLRLLVLIAAPRAAIERVIEKHPAVENLLTNGWLHLIAIEDQSFYRYSPDQSWHLLVAETMQACCSV